MASSRRPALLQEVIHSTWAHTVVLEALKMSANPVQYTGVEFVCKCGVRCRLDVSIESPAALQSYQHCGEDEARLLPGPLVSVWEERNGGSVTNYK